VRDRLPDSLQHAQGQQIEAEIGTLAAGASQLVRLDAVARQPGRFFNEVTATCAEQLEARSQAVVAVVEPGLGLRVEGPRSVPQHREADLRLEVTNPGTTPAAAVRLTQVLPEGLEVIGASMGGRYDARARSISWELGTLGPGQAQVMYIKARAARAGDWAYPAVVGAADRAETRSTQAIHIEPTPPRQGPAG
jgi:hypothetical protein